MEALKAGYNLVERDLIGHHYEDTPEVMSIIYFLRHLQSAEPLPRRLKVTGFDRLLAELDDLSPVHTIMHEAADRLLRRSPVILLPVHKLTMDTEPKIYWHKQEIRLRPLFGNRLEQHGVGHFYSPFNIP